MPSDTRPPETHEAYVGEVLTYCFDFTDDPVLTSGGTIGTPTVTTDQPSRVTVGATLVTTQTFQQLDRNGNVVASVAAGKGVAVTLTFLAKGGAEVKCKVAGSNGETPAAAANFVVRA